MLAAQQTLSAEAYAEPWGADADHLKTREDVEQLADAGYTFFTIDPSDHVNDAADSLSGQELEAAAEQAVKAGAFDSLAEAEDLYLNKAHDVPGLGPVAFDDRAVLYRAVAKYGVAVAFAEAMAGWIASSGAPNGSEIEISVDETATPTSLHEHLFIGLELQRRGVTVVSLAPRFVGDFEKGIDYRGDLGAFEQCLAEHVAVAKYCGPYKISIHTGSDKFSIYPIIGRVCGNLLHVKTAGTSYLEALRVVARESEKLFVEIAQFALGRFETDRATYQISANPAVLAEPSTLKGSELERAYLDGDDGRQVMHVTFGSVLTAGASENGRPFKDQIMEVLAGHAVLHAQVLEAHLGRHIDLLQAG